MHRIFNLTRNSLLVKALLSHRFPKIVTITMVSYQCLSTNIYANAGNQSVMKTSAPKTSAKASAKTSAKSYQVPEWWRREWMRRQQVRWFESKLLAREIKNDAKLMWNPRSPQAMAYRHAYLLSHKKQNQQSTMTPKSTTGSQVKSSSPDGMSQEGKKQP